MGPAILGSLSICFVSALVAMPPGIGTAIFLEEFKRKNAFTGLVAWLDPAQHRQSGRRALDFLAIG